MIYFRDELAHLQAPIAQMHVADDMPAIGAKQLLQRIPDDGRAQMSHMHGLGDIRTAEIDHESLARAGLRRSQIGIARHGVKPLGQHGIGDVEIDESGPRDFDLRKQRIGLQSRRNLLGDGARIGFRELRCRQRAVTLELCEIGPVGNMDCAKLVGEAFGGEGAPGARRQFRRQRNHWP